VRPAEAVDGLTITALTGDSFLDDAQAFIATQRQGWDPANTQPVTREDAEQLLQTSVRTGVCFLARLHGQPASAGVSTQPFDGVTEIAGIATLLPMRRRGIATALTGHAVRTAFAQGVEMACLSAGDEQASRVYERVGFHACATMLAYSVPAGQPLSMQVLVMPASGCHQQQVPENSCWAATSDIIVIS
jgi:GNAT superfamily N-acetyltransferase